MRIPSTVAEAVRFTRDALTGVESFYASAEVYEDYLRDSKRDEEKYLSLSQGYTLSPPSDEGGFDFLNADDAAFEACILVAHALGEKKLSPILYGRHFSAELFGKLVLLIKIRLTGEPLQYILGEWELMGLPFKVKSCALIPRQDTETLIEEALSLVNEKKYGSLLDICTGTGCIAISVARLGGVRTVAATDISAECVELARENAELNGVSVSVFEADLFKPFFCDELGKFDMITANPPYIPTEELSSLQREVLNEPRLALDGGADGLMFYRRIAEECKAHLNKGGCVLMEVGIGQAHDVASFFEKDFGDIRIIKDICGKDRVIVATYDK